jgi:hypothetical protein
MTETKEFNHDQHYKRFIKAVFKNSDKNRPAVSGDTKPTHFLEGVAKHIYRDKKDPDDPETILYVTAMNGKHILGGVNATVLKSGKLVIHSLTKEDGAYKKIGTDLLRRMAKFAKSKYPDVKKSSIGVLGDKPRLVEYYQKLGWKEKNEKTRYDKEDPDDSYTELDGNIDDIANDNNTDGKEQTGNGKASYLVW